MFTTRCTSSPREAVLQLENDDLRADLERRDRQEDDRRARRRQEARDEHEAQLRAADDWPDALRKQSILSRREERLDSDLPSPFFGSAADACDQAVVWWAEAHDRRLPEIAQLRARLAEIEREVRLSVAAQLEADPRSSESGWRNVANALRTEDDPTPWLNW